MEHPTPTPITRRGRLAAASLLAVATVAGPLAVASGAAEQTATVPVNLAGSTGALTVVDLADDLICDECVPDSLSPLKGATAWGGTYSFTTEASFVSPGAVDLVVDDADLEEGATAALQASLDPGDGAVLVTAKWSAALGFFNDPNWGEEDDDGVTVWEPVDNGLLPDGTWSGTVKTTAAGPCALPAPGQAPVTCTVDFGDVTLLELPILPLLVDVDIRLKLAADVSVDATGVTTVREVRVQNGPSLESGSIAWGGSSTPMSAIDELTMPCGPVGRDVLVDVGQTTYDTTVGIAPKLQLTAVLDLPSPPFDDIELELATLGAGDTVQGPAKITGTGGTAKLGNLAADRTAPTLVPTIPAGGAEGDAIPFQAVATDACSTPTIDWKLSDGGTMFGSSPVHVFADNGSYTGKVTARDARGNATTAQFALPISNVAPVAVAGPDHSTVWGVPVHFGGSATDKGSADLASMAYSWDFGDGTPSAAGGSSMSHAYATSGVYTSTFTATDKDGASHSASRTVTVRARGTEVAYTGPAAGLPKKTVDLKAAVSDELGQPVPGRTVRFSLGSHVVTAKTGADGVAVAPLRIDLKTGKYTMNVELVSTGADARYLPSSQAVPFTVGK